MTPGSDQADAFAAELKRRIEVNKDLFDFGNARTGGNAPLLLILDRKDDPVTPLLQQWSYQGLSLSLSLSCMSFVLS